MFSIQAQPVDMRPLGMGFDGSTSLLIKYAIVCVPLETPKPLFLHHYLAASDG